MESGRARCSSAVVIATAVGLVAGLVAGLASGPASAVSYQGGDTASCRAFLSGTGLVGASDAVGCRTGDTLRAEEAATSRDFAATFEGRVVHGGALPAVAAGGSATDAAAYSDVASLRTALADCTGTSQVPFEAALNTDLADSAAQLEVACDAVLDLSGHDLTVRNVVVDAGHAFELTDSTPDPEPAGTLTADASATPGAAGIQISDAILHLTGTARVAATGGNHGAGIGGADRGAGGTVIVDDASQVAAAGGGYAAGVGGGSSGAASTLVVNGASHIEASGGAGAAGIGGGWPGGDGGTVTVNGSSTVAANGGSFAAGIGGSDGGGDGGTVTVNDAGRVVATGGQAGAGIGGGAYGDWGGVLTVRGTVVATPGSGTAGCTVSAVGGTQCNKTPFTVSISVLDGGTLRLPTGQLVVPDSDPSGPEVTVAEGGRITGSADKTPTNATVSGAGQVENDGVVDLPTANVGATKVTHRHYRVLFDTQGGSTAPEPVTLYADTLTHGGRALPTEPTRAGYVFTGWGTRPDGAGTALTEDTDLTGAGASADGAPVPVAAYAQWGVPSSSLPALRHDLGSCAGTADAPYRVTLDDDLADPDTELVVACDAVVDLAGHDLSVGNVVIGPGHTFEVTDSISGAQGTLTADASSQGTVAGIQTTAATLKVTGTSRVSARGGANGAAIGGASGAAGGSLVIEDDGQVSAVGGILRGAGVGGGYGGAGGTVIVGGSGRLTATGGRLAAGVGGGSGGAGGTVTTTGSSQVVATGGGGAGIGGGNAAAGGALTVVDDSQVTAAGATGAAGVGGSNRGAGGTVRVDDAGRVVATGGPGAPGVGGGERAADGGVVLVAGTVAAIPGPVHSGCSPSALGGGPCGGTPTTLSVSVLAGGTLRLPAGQLVVPDSDRSGPEVTVADGGRITGSEDATPTYATVSGGGQVQNDGVVDLPTANVGVTAVTHRHYRIGFDTQGGSAAPDPVTVYADTLAHGDRALPPEPTRPGYSFLGWVTDPDGTGTELTADTELGGLGSSADGTAVPIVVHAQWGAASSSLPALRHDLGSCAGTPDAPYSIALADDLVDPDAELVVGCHAVVDLAGHDLTVRDVVIGGGHALEVTDSSPTSGLPGSLTADASAADEVAGIQTTGGALDVTGRAQVQAWGGRGGAGIGGAYHGAGGVVAVDDDGRVTATGGVQGAGIGGGHDGAGGALALAGDAQLDATGGVGAAGVGGGGGGSDARGGTVNTAGTSRLVATGGASAAGIGGGSGSGGGTVTVGAGSHVSATGGETGAGIGGGEQGTAGGSLSVAGTALAVPGASFNGCTASAIGGSPCGRGGPATPSLSVSVLAGGTLRLPAGQLLVPDSDPGGPEVTVAAGGRIAGGPGVSAPSYAIVSGAGQLQNDGVVDLPAANLGLVKVTHLHYRISFDTQGGSAAPDPVTVYADTLAHGNRSRSADPTRDGYVFNGWNNRPDGTGVVFTDSGDLTQLGSSVDGSPVEVRLYAQWVERRAPTVPAVSELAVAISGIPAENQVLHAEVTGPTAPSTGARLCYQWYADGVAVRPRGAGSALRLTPRMAGTRITVAVTATATGYLPSTSTSRPTGRVGRGHYLTANHTSAVPGEVVTVYGRGPRRVTGYRVTVSGAVVAGPLVGRTDGSGLFHQTVAVPRQARGKLRVLVTMATAAGAIAYRKRLTIVVTTS